MERKFASLLQLLAHGELELDKIRASITKAVSSDFSKPFQLLRPTLDTVSSFEVGKFLETRKVPFEQDEVRMLISQYDIQKKGKWDLDTFAKAFIPRVHAIEQSTSVENPREIEDLLAKFFQAEIELTRAAHPLRIQLYEDGSPISNLYKSMKKETKDDLSFADLDGFLRRNGVNLNEIEQILLLSRADKTEKGAISNREFETHLLPDVTRKKILGFQPEANAPAKSEKKPEQNNSSKPPTPKVTKTFADEPREHLEVTFRDSQNGFNLSNSNPQIRTDNVLPRDSLEDSKPVARTMASSTVPERHSEKVAGEVNRSAVIEQRPDPRFHTMQQPPFDPRFHPLQQPPAFAHPQQNNLQRSSVNSERDHVPSFFNPSTQPPSSIANSSANPQKVSNAPNQDPMKNSVGPKASESQVLPHQFANNLVDSIYIQSPQLDPHYLHPNHPMAFAPQAHNPFAQPAEISQGPHSDLHMSAPSQRPPSSLYISANQLASSPHLRTSQRPEPIDSSLVYTPEKPQRISMADLQAGNSLIQPFETGLPKIDLYSPGSASKKLSMSSHRHADSISSNYSLQRQGTPKHIKAKDLLGGSHSEARSPVYDRSQPSPSTYQPKVGVSPFMRLPSSAAQSPDKMSMRESVGTPGRLQKAVDLFISPQKTPKYVKFSEISSSIYTFQSAYNSNSYGY